MEITLYIRGFLVGLMAFNAWLMLSAGSEALSQGTKNGRILLGMGAVCCGLTGLLAARTLVQAILLANGMSGAP